MTATSQLRLRVRVSTLAVVAVLALVAAVFLRVSGNNPPGFHEDESAIAYNAYTLATTGKDEYGGTAPLFIRSFGDYKSPLYVYLLAAVFRVTGPSATVARTFSAVLGLAAVLVLYRLARSISRRRPVPLAVAALAGFSPWLYETTRVVLEVALMPLLLTLFLLAVHRAATSRWRWPQSAAIGLLLAAMAYAYQAGRVLAPLLAIGLALFWFRAGRRQLALTYGVFLAAAAPIGAWALRHPGGLGVRYHATTYIHEGMPWWDVAGQFLVHYARNMNLWAWAVHGDRNIVHHVPGDGSLFFVEVAAALAGIVVILLRHRSDLWWRYVLYATLVCPVAASVTTDVNTLRMIALPILLPLLALPALELLASGPRPAVRAAVAAAGVAVLAFEAVHWQVVYDRNGPDRLWAFDGSAHSAVAAALRRGGTVYASRSHGLYINLLWDAVAAGRTRTSTVLLEGAARPPAGGLYLGVVGDCHQCKLLDRDADFAVQRYRPAPPGVLRTSFQLTSPLLPVGSPLQFLIEVDNKGPKPADHVVLTIELPPAMRLAGPPWYQRGRGCTGSTTLVCEIGFFPKQSAALFRYGVTVTEGGPQKMTASLSSDRLDLNPAGTASAFTVNLTPPAYARSSPPPA